MLNSNLLLSIFLINLVHRSLSHSFKDNCQFSISHDKAINSYYKL